MSGKRYPEEFKREAVKQVTQRGHKIGDVARRLGTTSKSLNDWIKKYGVSDADQKEANATEAELKKLKAELRRVTEERDILKEAAAYFAGESKKSMRS
jgi:transposase